MFSCIFWMILTFSICFFRSAARRHCRSTQYTIFSIDKFIGWLVWWHSWYDNIVFGYYSCRSFHSQTRKEKKKTYDEMSIKGTCFVCNCVCSFIQTHKQCSSIMLRSKFIARDFVKWLIELKSSEINIDGKGVAFTLSLSFSSFDTICSFFLAMHEM